MSKKLSKQKLNDIITYGIVIAAFIIMQILIIRRDFSSFQTYGSFYFLYHSHFFA